MQRNHDDDAPQPFLLPLQIVAALLLVYLTTVHTLAGYLAETAPGTAIRLNSAQPLALTYLAEQALPAIIGSREEPSDSSPSETSRLEGFARLPKLELADDTAQEPEASDKAGPVQNSEAAAQTRDWLHRSVAAHPLNARALSLLATLSIGTNDDARALTLMNAAASRSGRIPLANYWLMRSNFEAKNYTESLRHADRLVRTTYKNMALAAPYLGRIADAATDDMAAMLLTNPPWRELFFIWLQGNIQDPRMPLQLLLKLKQSPVPATAAEFGPYVTLLINNKLYDLAYGAWLQSLDAEQLAHAGFIYNGAFDYPPASYPFAFEWSLKPGSGVIVDMVTLDNANRALMIKFGPGRADFKPVSQMTMLMPGNYTLTARYRGDIKSRRGLRWSIQCAGVQGAKLAESELIKGSTPSWTNVSLDFSVPKEGCRAQLVRFLLDARSASETMISGSIWIDDVAIKRQEPTVVVE
jgi:hypothetical protein